MTVLSLVYINSFNFFILAPLEELKRIISQLMFILFQIKRELRSPPPHHHSGGGSMSQPASYHHSALGGGADIFLSDEDELDQLLSSSQFAPLTSLYSDTQPRLAMSEHLVWKQRPPVRHKFVVATFFSG